MGKFKTVKIYIQEQQSADKGVLLSTIQSDEKGNILDKRDFDSEENLINSICCSYNERGQLVHEEMTDYLHSQGQIRNIVFEEDNRKIIETIKYQEGGMCKTVTILNNNNLPVRIERYYGEDDLDEIEEFEYNDKKQILKHQIYDSDGNIDTVENYTYEESRISIFRKSRDKEEKEIHVIENSNPVLSQIIKDGRVNTEVSRVYNDKGLIVNESIEQGDVIVGERTYGYDDAGNTVLEESQDYQNKRIKRTMKEYNSEGLVQKEVFFSTMGMDGNYCLTYEYE